ncbi:hypothetical protein K443DRAFT_681325 [Laccaria amethystina LaAM-08-1]|uniref:Uncharacterized protein n=1 Tax=Laccaria amethystina LaAM-08-1 TaxID=1095629 RepID=A0A0C9XJB0_9AGAR|nr:hypothetical protein K443DRAFT_681325 [Laccaria amethystina LaAM-08-1]
MCILACSLPLSDCGDIDHLAGRCFPLVRTAVPLLQRQFHSSTSRRGAGKRLHHPARVVVDLIMMGRMMERCVLWAGAEARFP